MLFFSDFIVFRHHKAVSHQFPEGIQVRNHCHQKICFWLLRPIFKIISGAIFKESWGAIKALIWLERPYFGY